MPVGEIWNLKTQEDILERTCRASQLGRYAAEIMWLPAGCRAVVSPSRLPCLSLRLCLRLFLRLARLVPLSPPPPPPPPALPTAHKPLSAGASLPHDEHRNPPPQPLPQALARQSSHLSPAAPSAAQAPAPHRTAPATASQAPERPLNQPQISRPPSLLQRHPAPSGLSAAAAASFPAVVRDCPPAVVQESGLGPRPTATLARPRCRPNLLASHASDRRPGCQMIPLLLPEVCSWVEPPERRCCHPAMASRPMPPACRAS